MALGCLRKRFAALCLILGAQGPRPGELALDDVGPDDRLTIENRDAPHQVLQLAHIAGPGMFAQALLGLGIQRLGCLTRRRTLAQEMPGQIDDILAALSQRWQADGNYIEAIKQVLAELALANRLAQVAMGGGDDPHIGFDRQPAADDGELALLQYTQQPGLRLQRHVADLVQEQRAASGLFEAADAPRDRAGKGALLMEIGR